VGEVSRPWRACRAAGQGRASPAGEGRRGAGGPRRDPRPWRTPTELHGPAGRQRRRPDGLPGRPPPGPGGPGAGGERARPAWYVSRARGDAASTCCGGRWAAAPLASTPSQLSVLVALTVALLADGSGRVRREANSAISQRLVVLHRRGGDHVIPDFRRATPWRDPRLRQRAHPDSVAWRAFSENVPVV
jgi:hypothetical protein